MFFSLNIILKIGSKYNLGCIITEDVGEESRKLLQKYKIEIFKINLGNLLHNLKFSKSHIQKIKDKHLFGKLSMFSLTNYEKSNLFRYRYFTSPEYRPSNE